MKIFVSYYLPGQKINFIRSCVLVINKTDNDIKEKDLMLIRHILSKKHPSLMSSLSPDIIFFKELIS